MRMRSTMMMTITTTTTAPPRQFSSSEIVPSLTTHLAPDPGCTDTSSPVLSPAGCASFPMTASLDPAQTGAPNSAAASDIVTTGVATVIYPDSPTISSIPTTFRTVVLPSGYAVPSSSHPQIHLGSRSASGNGTKIGGGVGGGLGGGLLLGLGMFFLVRYRKKRITQAEEGKPVSPDLYQQQGSAGSQPKPEYAPSPISGPEVYTEKPEPVSAPGHQGPIENMSPGLVELEAAPVARAMSPSVQGEGRYADSDGNDAASPVPAELPGSEVSIAELESPQLTATSPITTITAISALTTTTTATTPTITGASSVRGESQPPLAHRATSPRPSASHISRAISPSPSVFSYSSAPSEIHSLNEDAPRVLKPEERRQQLITLQEEVRRREEASPRRV